MYCSASLILGLRSHVTTFDRLWSCLPFLRPMVTIIRDSLADYGVDDVGGRCHDLLGTRCDPYGTPSLFPITFKSAASLVCAFLFPKQLSVFASLTKLRVLTGKEG